MTEHLKKVWVQIRAETIYFLPITGLRGSELTSATGLYAQLIPASLSSLPLAKETCSATAGDPVAARAIAPGLYRHFLTFNFSANDTTDNWVPALGLLNAETKPAEK